MKIISIPVAAVSPWNSLEVTKLIVVAATPVLVAVFGFFVTRRLKALESYQWGQQKVIEKRLEVFDRISPLLNQLLCYFTFIGSWKGITPPTVMKMKRELDELVYSNAPLFSPELVPKYRQFMDLCFRTYAGWLNEPKLVTATHWRKLAAGSSWQEDWDSLFDDPADANQTALAVREGYTQFVAYLAEQLGIGLINRQISPGEVPPEVAGYSHLVPRREQGPVETPPSREAQEPIPDEDRVSVPDHEDEDLPKGIKLADHRFGGGYLYKARELLVTRDDINLVRRELQERGIRLAPGEPQPIGETRLVRVFLHPDERKTVAEVVSILRAVDLEDRPVLQVFPNHVLVGAAHPRPHPGDSPRAAGPLDQPPPNGDGQPGAGVRVAVLDSGVVKEHAWLGTRAVPLTANDVEQPQFSSSDLNRFSGHGTFIAGVVLQCAPGAEVVAMNVFHPIGFVDDEQLAAALGAVPDDVQVINLSLGGPTHDNVGLPATEAALLALAQRQPRPVVVAAAGNEGDTEPTYPAAFNGVIAVGARQAPGGGRACFSNHGIWVDACAVGQRVHSTFFEDLDTTPEQIPPTCLADPPPGRQQFQGFATWSGTSFAAPCVAGAIAARMTEQNIDAVQAALQLVYANGLEQHPTGDLGTIVTCPGGGGIE